MMTNHVPAFFFLLKLFKTYRRKKPREQKPVLERRGREEGCGGERGGVVDETYICGRHR